MSALNERLILYPPGRSIPNPALGEAEFLTCSLSRTWKLLLYDALLAGADLTPNVI